MNTILVTFDSHKKAPAGLAKAAPRPLRSIVAICETYSSAVQERVWISSGSTLWANALVGCKGGAYQKLLLWEKPRDPQTVDVLRTFFKQVWVRPSMVTLPGEEAGEVLASAHPEHLFLGGHANRETEIVILLRGNLEPLHVPFRAFEADGASPKPVFEKFRVTDYGQVVKLGAYETSASSLLYRFDKDYRKFLKEEKLRLDTSFGAALKRLRLLRGLSQADFEPVIARRQLIRLENNEVANPRGKTLAYLAKKLNVDPTEIGSY